MTAIPLDTVFARAVARDPDALAVVDGAVRMTYAEWDGEIGRVAHGLTRLGIGTGDAVVVVLSNRVETATLFWACQRIGAAFVPFNWRGSGDDFAFAIGNAEAKAFVYEPRSEPLAAEALRATGFPAERQVRVGGAGGEGAAFEDLSAESGTLEARTVDPASDLPDALHLGDHRAPQGVPRSHDAERNASFNCVAHLRYGYGEVQLGVMPLFHTMGVRALEMATALNGAFVCMRASMPARRSG